jgi:hypothetical protein
MKSKRIRRALLISLSVIVLFVTISIVFISPITKYLIEKYDEKYTGRQIKMDWVYVNPFTGYFHFSNFRMYEAKSDSTGNASDSIFFSSKGINVDFSILKLFSKTYEISDLTFNQPWGIVIQYQSKRDFNFNDLIDKFKSGPKDTTKEPLHFSILNIKVKDGEFHYKENVIPINYFIKNADFDCSGFRWDVDTVTTTYFFRTGFGTGEAKGKFTCNTKNLNYRFNTVIKKLDMNLFEQYLKDLSNYGTVRATLDATLKWEGNFNNAKDLDANGHIILNDFHFGKNKQEDYTSFDKLSLGILKLSPNKNIFNFDSLRLDHPFFKYEQYDHLDNLENMFGKKGSNVRSVHEDTEHFNLILEIGDYVKKLVKNFFRSYYKINRVEIKRGDIKYNDYSLSEKFSVAAAPLFIEADSIDKNKIRVGISLKTGIAPYGNVNAQLSVNPKDSSDFDLNCQVKNIPVTLFNPYLISYTSFPMDRGTLEFNAAWHVQNGEIKSGNHLLIIDPRIDARIKRKDAKWLPLPLIMAFVRERGNAINYEIPITGNLNDPKFHIKDILLHLLENIFIKPPTTPYGIKVATVEKKIERSLILKWEMRDSNFKEGQNKFLRKTAEFLKENESSEIAVYPMNFVEKEKEYILFFEAKKKYFLIKENRKTLSFSKEDSVFVARMSVKDSGFIRYLDKHVGKEMIFTVQEKCQRFVGNEIVSKQFEELTRKRKEEFLKYFKETQTTGRVKMHSPENIVPYNGFSYYKINYNGEFPEKLRKAYEELNELNEEYPRNKYLNERKKLKDVLNVFSKN